jgi:phosphatidyl-myo-inositol alpha-mannosyltransferase
MSLTISFDGGDHGRRFRFQLPHPGAPTRPRWDAQEPDLEGPLADGGRLRIAHVTPYDLAVSGGVNATVRELVVRQRRLGHVVDVIGGASSESVMIPHWRRVRAAVLSLPANGSVAALTLPMSPEEGGELARVLERGQYHVLVLHEPSLPLCALTLRLSSAANVGTMHAYSERLRPPAGLLRFVLPPLDRLHRCIAVSEAARAYARTYLDVPYAVIPNGIDVSDHAASASRNGGEVLFVGRPEPRKGLDTLLQALPLLRRWVPNAHLVIAGDATAGDWAPYHALAGRLDIADAVSFLGRVSDAQKRMLFERAAVFCSPATGGESQGVVLLEALASRTPVVASNIAGYRTVITPGQNGLLVPAGKPDRLANGLRRVLQDDHLASRLAAAGRQTIEQTYAWSVVIPRLLAEYRAVIGLAASNQGVPAA